MPAQIEIEKMAKNLVQTIGNNKFYEKLRSNHNSVIADVAYFKPIRNKNCNKRDGKDETE